MSDNLPALDARGVALADVDFLADRLAFLLAGVACDVCVIGEIDNNQGLRNGCVILNNE